MPKAIQSPICSEADAMGPLGAIRRWFQRQIEQRVDRMAFRTLERLSDADLRDIGLTRADVEWASRLPLSENASAALQEVARQRRREISW